MDNPSDNTSRTSPVRSSDSDAPANGNQRLSPNQNRSSSRSSGPNATTQRPRAGTARTSQREAYNLPPAGENQARLVKILGKLAASGSTRKMEAILLKLHPADIAEAMLQLPLAVNQQVVGVLYEHRRAGSTLAELPSGVQAEILNNMDVAVVSEIVRRLPPDDAVDVLQSLDEDVMHEAMRILKIAEVSEIEQLLLYNEDTAGGIMSPDAFRLEQNISIAEARSRLRAESELADMQFLYIVDEWNHLVGCIDFRRLLFAPEEASVSDHMWENVLTVLPTTPAEVVAREMSKYDLLEVPVIDKNGHLLGVITIDDIIDVIQEIATEEIYAMAGLDEEDRIFSSPLRSIRLRLPWLTVNLITAFASASLIGLFADILREMIVLAVVFPVIASTGGNAAIQTITLIVRGFTLGEISAQNATRAVLRELAVAVGNGLAIGIVAAIAVFFWKRNLDLSLVVFTSMALNFLIAGLAGSLIPLLIKKLRYDPAVASGIFVTAITDIGGYVLFLALANAWLR